MPSLSPAPQPGAPGRWREVPSAAERGRLPAPGPCQSQGSPSEGTPLRAGASRRVGAAERGRPPARLRQGGGRGSVVPGGRLGAAPGRGRLTSRPPHQVLALRERAQSWCRIPSRSPCVAEADLRRRTAAEGDPSV